MSKVLRTVAVIVGAVALVATGIGAAVGAGILGSVAAGATTATFAGLSAATFATIGTIASVAAAALSLVATAINKPPGVTQSGDQTKFTASKDQGVPYAIGRTSVSGFVAHQQTWDAAGSTNNAYRTFFGVWSAAGPIHEVESFSADNVVVGFSGGEATGSYHGSMWLNTQLGNAPETAALTATSFYPYPSGWSSTSKLSGYAAFAWTLKFDTDGKIYPGAQVPPPSAVLKGVRVYDPRQDSTFPGGSGPCRALDESTYVWDGIDSAHPAGENPFLHGLTWAIGRWSNAKRVLGIGMALAAIDVPAYAAAANIADANSWKVGGVVYSTDGKWDVLKKILAAGSGAPLQLGGILSCTVDTPRVSLATITTADIIGDVSVTGTPASKDRINGVIPTYRDEAQRWQLVPAAQVQVAAYVTADGRPRTRGITWELVQNVDQVAQLATYYIGNSREFGPIVMPLKLRWIGYKPGDALTIASPEAGMQSQLAVIQKRHLDPTTGAVTLTMRSETTDKHAFALGKTGTPPPTPSLQTVDVSSLLLPGVSASWSAIADDDGNKPEDGATVGAPGTTPVGDRTAQDVIDSLDVNVNAILEQALRQDDLLEVFDARTLVEGQPVGPTFLTFRNEQQTQNSAIESTFTLLGAKNSGGTAFDLNLDTVNVSPTQTLAQRLSQISAAAGDASASVTALQEAIVDGSGGYARASQLVAADGSVAGYSSSAGGGTSAFNLVGQKINLTTSSSGANLINLISFTGGRWVFGSGLYIQSIVDGAVVTNSLAQSAASQTTYALLSSDVTCAGSSSATIFSKSFTKDQAGSLLRVMAFLQATDVDDLQFTATITVSGAGGVSIQRTSRVNLTFTGSSSQAETPITPFAHFAGLAAGTYTVTIDITNMEASGDTLSILADSALEITELKKGVL